MAEEDSLELKEFESEKPAAPAADAAEPGAGSDGVLIDSNGMPAIDALPSSAKDLESVYDIPVQVSAVLGKSTMQVSQLLKLGRGSVVELDRKVGEPIDIYVNNRLVARGEVVIVDERLGVTMKEIIKTDRTA